MLIEFSKVWGHDGFRWNYCGGDYNFRTLAGFMDFYGIEEATITGKDVYYDDICYDTNDWTKPHECYVYEGFVTKELERVKRHWSH